MVWLVLLTPAGLLALILTMAFVERGLFPAPGGSMLPSMGANPGADIAGNDQREIHWPGAAGQRRLIEPALTRPLETPSVREAVRPRSGRTFRFLGSSHLLSRIGRSLSDPGAGRPPTVSPKTALDTENLFPGTVSKIVSGDCVRCGDDLSRGFATARDSAGQDEGTLVCLSCEWLDDAGRESLHQATDAVATRPGD